MHGPYPHRPGFAGPPCWDSGGECRLELGLEAPLWHRPDDALGLGAVTEQDQGGDREHVESARGLLVLVDVDADDVEVVALCRHLLQDRMDDAARTTPGGPEIDQHGLLRFEHLGLEGSVGRFGQLPGHFAPPDALPFTDLSSIRQWPWERRPLASGQCYTKYSSRSILSSRHLAMLLIVR